MIIIKMPVTLQIHKAGSVLYNRIEYVIRQPRGIFRGTGNNYSSLYNPVYYASFSTTASTSISTSIAGDTSRFTSTIAEAGLMPLKNSLCAFAIPS